MPDVGGGDGQVADVTVVIPVRNAERLLPACLESVLRDGPQAVIVVDGESTDRTVEIAREYGVTVISDEGRGLPVARQLGVELAETRYVALVDADVVIPRGALRQLRDELVRSGLAGLQAGALSTGGPGYWGRALAQHYQWGRSKKWFGLFATIFERHTLVRTGFDRQFASGEDIELRWRLRQAAVRVGVSERTIVTHRFAEDSFAFARGQFNMDGHGLGKMIKKYGLRGAPLLALPGAAAARGLVLSLVRLRPQWIPYYLCFGFLNYSAMFAELFSRQQPASTGSVWVASLELDGDGLVAGLNGSAPPDEGQARVLVSLHGAPLGFVIVPVAPAQTLTPRVRSAAESTLADAISRHRELDAQPSHTPGETNWTATVACPRQFPARGEAGMSIVICTRDRTESLRDCLRAIRMVTYEPIEVLVVDNAPSGTDTRALVAEIAANDPRIRYACEPQPGLAAARNHGLAQARYDLVAFTDDDALVDPGWPTALAAGFASDPSAACVTGFVPSGALDTWSERYFDARYAWGEIAEPRRYDMLDHRVAVRFYPFAAGLFGTGANFAVRRGPAASVGGFDPLLGAGAPGLGGEDLDMFLRLVLAGGRICYLPSAFVWHRHRSEPAALGDQIYCYGHGLGAYLAKHIHSRQLRAALIRHGLPHIVVTISRMWQASRSSQQRSRSAALSIRESRAVIAGALTYRRAARQASRRSSQGPLDGSLASSLAARQREDSLP